MRGLDQQIQELREQIARTATVKPARAEHETAPSEVSPGSWQKEAVAHECSRIMSKVKGIEMIKDAFTLIPCLSFSPVPAFFDTIWIGLGRGFIAFLPLFARILEISLVILFSLVVCGDKRAASRTSKESTENGYKPHHEK